MRVEGYSPSGAGRMDCPLPLTFSITTTGTEPLPMLRLARGSCSPEDATAWAPSPRISITTVGPTSMLPATRRPACFTITVTTAPSRNRRSPPVWRTTSTGNCNPAWASPWPITMATVSSTSQKRTSPAISHRSSGTRTASFLTDVSPLAGLSANHLLGWGIAFIDLDDDGWKDLVIANGHVYPEVDRAPVGDRYLQKTLLYHNLGNGKFTDITAQAGPALQTPRPARGLAVGDVDGRRPPLDRDRQHERARPACSRTSGRARIFYPWCWLEPNPTAARSERAS